MSHYITKPHQSCMRYAWNLYVWCACAAEKSSCTLVGLRWRGATTVAFNPFSFLLPTSEFTPTADAMYTMYSSTSQIPHFRRNIDWSLLQRLDGIYERNPIRGMSTVEMSDYWVT